MLYGNRVVLLANNQPLWIGADHGVLWDKIEKIRKWRRTVEGEFGALVAYLKLDAAQFAHLTPSELISPVDRLTWTWFTGGKPSDRGESVL